MKKKMMAAPALWMQRHLAGKYLASMSCGSHMLVSEICNAHFPLLRSKKKGKSKDKKAKKSMASSSKKKKTKKDKKEKKRSTCAATDMKHVHAFIIWGSSEHMIPRFLL